MKNIILITRPEESAAETAYDLNQKGYLTFCEPMMEVAFHDEALPDLSAYEALVFTSANAVQAFILKSERRDITAFCVGENTLQAVRNAGFEHYQSAQGKVSDLITMLEEQAISGKLLYVRAQDISQSLAVSGREIDEAILYHTEKSEEISENCLDLMGRSAFSHILFYSKRTAEIFAELTQKHGVNDALNHCEALCLGDSMVECITNLQWKRIRVAPTPDRQGMLHLLENEHE